jgi:hypothetical protein
MSNKSFLHSLALSLEELQDGNTHEIVVFNLREDYGYEVTSFGSIALLSSEFSPQFGYEADYDGWKISSLLTSLDVDVFGLLPISVPITHLDDETLRFNCILRNPDNPQQLWSTRFTVRREVAHEVAGDAAKLDQLLAECAARKAADMAEYEQHMEELDRELYGH